MSYSLIHNGTLIDGTGRKPIANGAVLLKDNKIHASGRKPEIPLPDADVSLVDAMGGFILPGLIDTHVHLMLEDINIPKMMITPFSLRFYASVGRMKRTIDTGITTVRDAGGADAGVKQAVDQGLVLGPRMQISITALSITGGHADGWMLSGNIFNLMPSYPGMPTNICDGIEDVRRKVREVLRAGADVIKVCSTGGVLSPTDHPQFTQFTPDELKVIVQEAEYRKGIKVMAHAQGAEGIKNAVRAGIHSIEHGLYLDDEAIELMLNAGTYLVPTLLAPVAVVEIAESAGTMPEYGIKKAREVIEYHADSISRAHKAGVKIAMGTDAGVMPHGTNLRELNLMRIVGMSPQEVIVATTKTAAECMGLENELGTIEKGKLADVIVVSVDPLNNLQALEDVNNIQLVIKDGQIVKDIRANLPI
jgi:imidazolonepropionase-like amidohydrolase